MELFDQKKLEMSIISLDRLSDGRDPASNEEIPHIPLDDPCVIRCLWFSKNVLQAVLRNGGKVGSGKSGSGKAAQPDFPMECLEKYTYNEDKTVTHFLAQIKSLADDPHVKGISVRRVTDWLKAKGYLDTEVNRYNGKNETVVTEAGQAFGVYMERRVSSFGREYNLIMYSRKAQEYIVEHMQAILDGEV